MLLPGCQVSQQQDLLQLATMLLRRGDRGKNHTTRQCHAKARDCRVTIRRSATNDRRGRTKIPFQRVGAWTCSFRRESRSTTGSRSSAHAQSSVPKQSHTEILREAHNCLSTIFYRDHCCKILNRRSPTRVPTPSSDRVERSMTA